LYFASPFPTPPSPLPTGPCEPLSDASPGDFQRSPLRRALLKSPLPRRHCCRHFGTNGATARPCSVCAVFHHRDGFLLSNPAHLLQCAADHGVRDVLCGLRNRRLIALVLPFEVFSPFPAARHHSRGNLRVDVTSFRCSPSTFPPHPFPVRPSLHR